MVELGFVENCEPWRLESRFFPSKVGGKPAWLDLKNIPNADDLACDYCHDPCIFLCQIYAPIEDYPNTFHRTIYVFICKKIDCCRLNQNGNLKVFRSQLSRSNIFYPSEPPTEDAMWRRDIGKYRRFHIYIWASMCIYLHTYIYRQLYWIITHICTYTYLLVLVSFLRVTIMPPKQHVRSMLPQQQIQSEYAANLISLVSRAVHEFTLNSCTASRSALTWSNIRLVTEIKQKKSSVLSVFLKEEGMH